MLSQEGKILLSTILNISRFISISVRCHLFFAFYALSHFHLCLCKSNIFRVLKADKSVFVESIPLNDKGGGQRVYLGRKLCDFQRKSVR
jgi:hypothetical protein